MVSSTTCLLCLNSPKIYPLVFPDASEARGRTTPATATFVRQRVVLLDEKRRGENGDVCCNRWRGRERDGSSMSQRVMGYGERYKTWRGLRCRFVCSGLSLNKLMGVSLGCNRDLTAGGILPGGESGGCRIVLVIAHPAPAALHHCCHGAGGNDDRDADVEHTEHHGKCKSCEPMSEKRCHLPYANMEPGDHVPSQYCATGMLCNLLISGAMSITLFLHSFIGCQD